MHWTLNLLTMKLPEDVSDAIHQLEIKDLMNMLKYQELIFLKPRHASRTRTSESCVSRTESWKSSEAQRNIRRAAQAVNTKEQDSLATAGTQQSAGEDSTTPCSSLRRARRS